MNEFDFISKYLSKLAINNTNAKKLNDDVFFDKKNKLVLSVDTYNEGIHFINFKNPKLIIKKIIRSSISDLICKGVKPKYYFVSSCIRKGLLNKKSSEILLKSLREEQKKFNIKISGGDTTNAKTLSFTIVSVGYANKIVERNKAKKNDDIYVTGNIGDSYIGLQILKKKFANLPPKIKKNFIKEHYLPSIPYKYYKVIKKYANTSIDISDGLVSDLNKLINRQKTNYCIYENKIPLSNKLKFLIKKYKLKKENYLFNGDDYQILFTAPKKHRNQLFKISSKMSQKITIIGNINDNLGKNLLIKGNNSLNLTKFKGYSHTI